MRDQRKDVKTGDGMMIDEVGHRVTSMIKLKNGEDCKAVKDCSTFSAMRDCEAVLIDFNFHESNGIVFCTWSTELN